MKKVKAGSPEPEQDDLRPEYDLRSLRLRGVGEHFKRMAAKHRYVQLDADVAEFYRDEAAVNQTLREAMKIAKINAPARKRRTA